MGEIDMKGKNSHNVADLLKLYPSPLLSPSLSLSLSLFIVLTRRVVWWSRS
jgi:hypothetical protein